MTDVRVVLLRQVMRAIDATSDPSMLLILADGIKEDIRELEASGMHGETARDLLTLADYACDRANAISQERPK